MPIKEKSTYKKHEYEYVSPDDDTWRIIYVENFGRKYLQIGKSDQKEEDMTTWDVEMLLDLADKIRSLTSKRQKAVRISSGGRPHRGLQQPRIKDHRSASQSELIQSQVDETMRQLPDDEMPLQSFSPKTEDREWGSFRAGFDIKNSGHTSETPPEYKYEQTGEDSPESEIAARNASKVSNRPVVVKRGTSGSNFRRGGNRISASEIV